MQTLSPQARAEVARAIADEAKAVAGRKQSMDSALGEILALIAALALVVVDECAP